MARFNSSLTGPAALTYGTYLGGSDDDEGENIAVTSGGVYLTGLTSSADFATSANAWRRSCVFFSGTSSCSTDAFVTKLSLSGTLLYSSYFGGTSGDEAFGLAVDNGGNAIISGYTVSADLPTTANAFDRTCGSDAGGSCNFDGSSWFLDAFVARFNPAAGSGAASLLYSSYLGGSSDDAAYGVAVDASGNVYLTGDTTSNNFPLTSPLQGSRGGSVCGDHLCSDAFVSKLNVGGSSTTLAYSSYLGGSRDDRGLSIALDSAGNAYVSGETSSSNFPTSSPLFAPLTGDVAFVAKISTSSVPPAPPAPATRVVSYSYDGLERLRAAVESPGNSYVYSYDNVGNRTQVTLNGTLADWRSYDAADRVVGWSYDAAGNLLSDGVANYSYDAFSRVVGVTQGSQTRTNTYNGEDVLVAQVINGTSKRYTQDLAAPLSQVLQITQGSVRTDYLYGTERLAAYDGSSRGWYLTDALGSVRRALTDAGVASGPINYDPWGNVESGAVGFGFAGELQDSAIGLVNLRARWYSSARGTFTSRDPFEGFPEQPYSMHPYQYGYSDPVLNTDRTGRVVAVERGGGGVCPRGWELSGAYCIHVDAIESVAGLTAAPGLRFLGAGGTGAQLCAIATPCIAIAAAGGGAAEIYYFTIAPDAESHQQALQRGAEFEAAQIMGAFSLCINSIGKTIQKLSNAFAGDKGGSTGSPPAPTPPPDPQEDALRKVLGIEYDQPYGESDILIRQNLLSKDSKVADFVGQSRTTGRWLIAESKGGDMYQATQQLRSTMNGLLAKDPAANGRIDLRIYTNQTQYERLFGPNGLGGYRLDTSGYLGYIDDVLGWVYEEINGVRILVQAAP